MALLTRKGRPAASPAAGDGSFPHQTSPQGRRRAAALAAIGAGTYALALLWMLPAAIVAPDVPGLVLAKGRAWSGRALLTDGSWLGWRVAPLRSLVGLGLAADWTMDGQGTALAGQVLARRKTVLLDDVAGTASMRLLPMLGVDLPFACDASLDIALPHASMGDDWKLTGEIRSGAGSCTPRGGGEALVGPLAARFSPSGSGTDIQVSPLAMRRRALLDGNLASDGQLRLRVTRDGAAALPFLSPSGGMQIETRL